jgi:RimJ/RimL family protein N-acetyltransferase
VLNIDVTPFGPEHAALAVELAARAFTVVAADARPRDSAVFLGHIHGASNPSGRAWIAIAREEGRAVASVAAVPARFRTRAGKIVIGFQIGTFVVDPALQRQGLGTRILAELTRVLKELPDTFIYAYPNPRSQAVLDRSGYRRVAEIPTVIYLPRWRSLSAKRTRQLEDAGRATWDLAFPRGSEMEAALRAIGDLEVQPAGFIRDRSYFTWRFLGPECAERYDFVVCSARSTQRAFVLALARHQFKSLRFTILVDAFPNVFSTHHALAIRAAEVAARRSGAWFVYLNTSATSQVGTPWSVRLPADRNPRPVQLMLYPENSAIAPADLAESLAMTADWNGF